MTDKNATYIFTSGNDKTRYTSMEDLYNEAEKIGIYKDIYIKDLIDAIDFANDNYKSNVIFIVGSFYVYGDVVKKIKSIS